MLKQQPNEFGVQFRQHVGWLPPTTHRQLALLLPALEQQFDVPAHPVPMTENVA